MFSYIVCANGIYDVVCAVGIIVPPNTFLLSSLGCLHPNMFVEPIDAVTRRILSYWLATYGVVRIAAVMNNDIVDILVIFTYLFEAYVFTLEYIFYKTTHGCKVAWVSASSILLAVLLHYK
jgi:hypothetical protein